MQLSFLEEPSQCAPSAVGAKRSSEDPPQVSTQPSVQELQGALSLGNGKIIKQVTSGTCFSEVTSGRDNSVSVSDGRGFRAGRCSELSLIDWQPLGRALSAPTRSSLCLHPEPPRAAPAQQGLWASAGAGVGRRHRGDPGDQPAPGLGRDTGRARRELGVGSSVPELCARDESYEKNSRVKRLRIFHWSQFTQETP